MKSSHSASVTSPALPPESPPLLTNVDAYTPPAANESGGKRREAASFMQVKANTIGNKQAKEKFPPLFFLPSFLLSTL